MPPAGSRTSTSRSAGHPADWTRPCARQTTVCVPRNRRLGVGRLLRQYNVDDEQQDGVLFFPRWRGVRRWIDVLARRRKSSLLRPMSLSSPRSFCPSKRRSAIQMSGSAPTAIVSHSSLTRRVTVHRIVQPAALQPSISNSNPHDEEPTIRTPVPTPLSARACESLLATAPCTFYSYFPRFVSLSDQFLRNTTVPIAANEHQRSGEMVLRW